MKAPRGVQPPPERGHDPIYRQLWEIVDAALVATFEAHPDYLTEHGREKARQSIAKRVVGALVGVIRRAEGGGK